MNDRAQYLYSEDLIHGGQFRTARVQIEEVIPAGRLRSADGKVVDRPALRFAGKSKLLILCRTNEQVLPFVTGGGPEAWPGKTVTLQARVIKAFGDEVVAIRIMPEPGQAVRRSIKVRLGAPAELRIESITQPARAPAPAPAASAPPATAQGEEVDEFEAAYRAAEQAEQQWSEEPD